MEDETVLVDESSDSDSSQTHESIYTNDGSHYTFPWSCGSEDEPTYKTQVYRLMRRVSEAGEFEQEFAVYGLLSDPPTIALEIYEEELFEFPIENDDAGEMLELIKSVSEDLNESDDSGRSNGCFLYPEFFKIISETGENVEWAEYMYEVILPRVFSELSLNFPVEARLRKLAIFDEGSSMGSQELDAGGVGVVFVQLPSFFTGGRITVYCEKSQRRIDISNDEGAFYFVAFLAHCDVEIQPVSFSTRFLLIYDLILADADSSGSSMAYSGCHANQLSAIHEVNSSMEASWIESKEPTKGNEAAQLIQPGNQDKTIQDFDLSMEFGSSTEQCKKILTESAKLGEQIKEKREEIANMQEENEKKREENNEKNLEKIEKQQEEYEKKAKRSFEKTKIGNMSMDICQDEEHSFEIYDSDVELKDAHSELEDSCEAGPSKRKLFRTETVVLQHKCPGQMTDLQEIVTLLSNWPEGQKKLVYMFENRYIPQNFSFENLKARDLGLLNFMKKLSNDWIPLHLHIAFLISTKKGTLDGDGEEDRERKWRKLYGVYGKHSSNLSDLGEFTRPLTSSTFLETSAAFNTTSINPLNTAFLERTTYLENSFLAGNSSSVENPGPSSRMHRPIMLNPASTSTSSTFKRNLQAGNLKSGFMNDMSINSTFLSQNGSFFCKKSHPISSFAFGRIDETNVYLDNFQSLEEDEMIEFLKDQKVSFAVHPNELMPSGTLNGMPDSQEYSGPKENQEIGSLEHLYYRAVLVFWPSSIQDQALSSFIPSINDKLAIFMHAFQLAKDDISQESKLIACIQFLFQSDVPHEFLDIDYSAFVATFRIFIALGDPHLGEFLAVFGEYLLSYVFYGEVLRELGEKFEWDERGVEKMRFLFERHIQGYEILLKIIPEEFVENETKRMACKEFFMLFISKGETLYENLNQEEVMEKMKIIARKIGAEDLIEGFFAQSEKSDD